MRVVFHTTRIRTPGLWFSLFSDVAVEAVGPGAT